MQCSESRVYPSRPLSRLRPSGTLSTLHGREGNGSMRLHFQNNLLELWPIAVRSHMCPIFSSILFVLCLLSIAAPRRRGTRDDQRQPNSY